MASISCFALLSPYQRPVLLQPMRMLTELNRMRFERTYELDVAKMGVDVEIRSAGKRGKGLFALRPFEADEIVAPYTGVFSTEEEFMKAQVEGRTSGDYVAEADPMWGSACMLDAEDGSSTAFGRFVNHSLRKQNVYIMAARTTDDQPTGLTYMVTTKKVPAGGEFFTNYGRGYWDERFEGRFDPLGRLMVDYF